MAIINYDLLKGNHVLLINPRIPNSSQNEKINRIVGITFPSSLGVLASCLRAKGIEAQVVDEQLGELTEKEIIEILGMMSRPAIIGLSVLTLNCSRAYELAQHIKRIDGEVTLLMGGLHPTVCPDEVVMQPEVDFIIRGEAEISFTETVQRILAGESYLDVDGVSYKDSDGNVIHNTAAPLVQNLDDIPPFPFDKFEKSLHLYPGFSSVTGSRGCPHNCTFCSARSISGRRYRFLSAERVVQEIETLVRQYGQTSVFFMDDNIAVNKKHFYRLCDLIMEKGLHKEAYFHGSMRADNATEEVLQTAKEANFKIIYYGMETGVERLMKIVNKGETVQQIIDAVHLAHKVGIQIGTTIIFGLPTETRKDRYDTMKLVKSLPIASIRFNTLTPYPGTPAFESEHPKGNVFVKGAWENFGVQYMWESDDIPYVPDTSNRLELIWDTMYANMSTYLSVKGVWKLIRNPVAGGNVIRLKNKWYLQIQELSKILSAFFYLFRRFLSVTMRMLWGMMLKKS